MDGFSANACTNLMGEYVVQQMDEMLPGHEIDSGYVRHFGYIDWEISLKAIWAFSSALSCTKRSGKGLTDNTVRY